MPTFTCPVCGKSFHQPLAWVKRIKAPPCCSRECRAQYQSKPDGQYIRPNHKRIICACGCGQSFDVTTNGRQSIYKRGHKPKRITAPRQKKQPIVKRKREPVFVSCSQCGKQFRVPPSKAKRYQHFFCNVECRSAYIVGENNPSYRSGLGRHPYYGANWKSQRRKALERDNYTCQCCHKIPKHRRNLHVHHITPAFTFNGDYIQANELSNLITLCHRCHKQAEQGVITLQRRMF